MFLKGLLKSIGVKQHVQSEIESLPSTNSGHIERRATLTLCLLDQSVSMKEKDYPPSRIEAGKQAIRAFAEKRRRLHPEDWLGVFTFGSYTKIVSPAFELSDDSEFQRFLKNVKRIRIGGGTRLDRGLWYVRTFLKHNRDSFIYGDMETRILVLTDGKSAGKPLSAATCLKKEGVIIEIIGIGGSPNEVNEPLLKRCASFENGKLLYRFIGDGNSEALVEHFGRLALS